MMKKTSGEILNRSHLDWMWIWSLVISLIFAGAGLQIGAEFVHAVERVQKKGSDCVYLHQRQVVQLHGDETEETQNEV